MLRRYPKSSRNIERRTTAKKPTNIAKAMHFEFDYFDGERETGYGGYHYDGRWLPIAEDFVDQYKLTSNSRVLDVGAAKGFLMRDLMHVCPGIEVIGLDISKYAIDNAHSDVSGRMIRGSADVLPLPSQSFDLAISINTIHNLNQERCILALSELERVATTAYVQVDSWFNENQKTLFLDWMLTAKTYGDRDYWQHLFETAGYHGDFYWTVMD
jgi:SAM-dependent methyltransferase